MGARAAKKRRGRLYSAGSGTSGARTSNGHARPSAHGTLPYQCPSRLTEESPSERRTSRTAGPFLPLDPPPLPRRATAARLDPEAALAPWLDALPSASIEAGRAYLERLAEEGVREPEAEGSP